jgi:putative MATE family efflux protein
MMILDLSDSQSSYVRMEYNSRSERRMMSGIFMAFVVGLCIVSFSSIEAFHPSSSLTLRPRASAWTCSQRSSYGSHRTHDSVTTKVFSVPTNLTDQDTFDATVDRIVTSTENATRVSPKGETTKNPSPAPTLRECLSFALPALGIYACPPLMSLIDAAFIGRSSSVELAALGPASSISDSAPLPLLFLSIAATNLIAKSFSRNDERNLTRVSRTALGLGSAGGVILAALLYRFAFPISHLYCGESAVALAPLCTKYVAIRALALPAVVVTTVAQAICIGTKDTKTPMISVAVAGLLNLVGDFILVKRLGQGIAGAAWATALSQVLAAGLLLRVLKRRGFLQPPENETPTDSTATLLSRLGVSPSTADTARQLFGFLPFLFVMGVKMGWHNACAATAASLGGSEAAAHTALLSVGMLCFVLGDVGSSLSQAFIPAFVGERPAAQVLDDRQQKEPHFDLEAALPTIQQVLKCTLAISTTVVCLASIIIGRFGSSITQDPTVLSTMRRTLPWLATALSMHGSAVTLEGILLARRKLRGLTIFYSFLALTILGFQIATRQLGLGLMGVWGCYCWVCGSRIVAFSALGGLLDPLGWWRRIRRTDKESIVVTF